MSEKKAYPLRISAEILGATQRWADDELRSVNAQLELLLRDALRKAGRLPADVAPPRPRGRPPKETKDTEHAEDAEHTQHAGSVEDA